MTQSQETVVLRSGRVVLGGGGAPYRIEPATITIREDLIVSVDTGLSNLPPDTIDLGDELIAPAFINAHTHLSMGAFRGLLGAEDLEGNVVEDLFFKLESGLEPEDVRAFSRMGAYECLLSGVGMVWDHYYHAVSVAQALADVGLTGVVAPTLQDLSGPGVAQLEQQLEATVQLDDETWARRGVFAALGPHATDTVSPALWERLTEISANRKLPVHAHVAQSVEEFERAASRHATTPLGLLERHGVLEGATSLLAVHGIFLTDEDLGRLDTARHTLGYCPLSQQQFCFPAHVPSWVAAGQPFVVGTDCSMSNDAMNVQRELVAVAGVRGFGPSASAEYRTFREDGTLARAQQADAVRTHHHGRAGMLLQPDRLLDTVWGQAGGMHPVGKAGSIEPGRLANLIVLDPEHPNLWPGADLLRGLAYADAAPAIHTMMVRGRWIGERGDFRQVLRAPEYRAAATEARERLEAHLSKIGWKS